MPLRPEVAKERLSASTVADGHARRLERVRDLPGALRAIAEPIIEYPKEIGGELNYNKWHELRDRAVRELEGQAAEERRRVFDAFFPATGMHVGAAWDLFRRLPYQSGGARRPFRAPNEPVTGATARAAWLYQLLDTTRDYERDAVWLATWAPYLGWGADALGILLAAAIDAGGAEGGEVFAVLAASARGEHEIGAMGRHVTRALLVCEREEGWQLVERLLRAAQGQEGLRQTILEAADEAHPTAFRRVLRLIVDEGLARFSATVRALDVWLGHGWDVQHRREVERTLTSILTYLESAEARANALRNGDGAELYLALWSCAFEDAPGAVEPAAAQLHDASVERRFAAVYLLSQLGLSRSARAVLPALDDPDLRVAERALAVVVRGAGEALLDAQDGIFARLEQLLARAPATKTTLPPLLWPWLTLTLDRGEVAGALVYNLGDRPASALLPYLAVMSAGDRAAVADKLEPDAAETRGTLFSLVGDASAMVRERALKAIARLRVGEDEARRLEALLTRRASDLRRGVLTLLAAQSDGAALESARRLLAGAAEQRAAGLELLRELAKADRAAAECRTEARRYHAARPEVSDAERSLLDGLLEPHAAVPALDDALGLMDPAQRTPAVPPVEARGLRLTTDAAYACLEALDALVHAHRETPVRQPLWTGDVEEELLGTVRWLRVPDAPEASLTRYWSRHAGGAAERPELDLPLREVWERWWSDRPAGARDPDGFELLRAAVLLRSQQERWRGNAAGQPAGSGARIAALRYTLLLDSLLTWLLWLHPPDGAVDFVLAAFETALAQGPATERARPAASEVLGETDWHSGETDWHSGETDWHSGETDWHSGATTAETWLALTRWHRGMFPAQWEDTHHVRLWRALRWRTSRVKTGERTGEQIDRQRPELWEVCRAHRAGGATDADVFDQLLGARPIKRYARSFDDLRGVSGRKGSPLFEECPALRDVVDRCRRRIVDVESARGDLPTAASPAALQLRWSGGLNALVRLLTAHGTRPFVRGWIWGGGQDRASVLSHLIHATFPEPEDTPDTFAGRMRAARVSHTRLLELAVYAPQWVKHVERTLGWPQLEEAVWWVHAHTKDTNWQVDHEIREVWTAQVAERTPLAAQDLVDGAVDVAWFQRVYGALGPERWRELDAAAKYASGGGGHKRAQLFADAMRGEVTKDALVTRVREKRHADSLRALGLAPLAGAKGKAARERDVLERYQVIQEFLRGSRQFGALRQESEKLAVSIAMQNLARTAGYRDPNRLRWAMEAEAVADLARGPVTAAAGSVSVTLSIDGWGTPRLAVEKQGRPLRAVPAAAKKDPAVAVLVERRRDIERQASRMRAALEDAMCRGDTLTGRELRRLLAHPVLRPMLRALVLVVEAADKPATPASVAGYPVDDGAVLEAYDGRRVALEDRATLRVAHPHDLLGSGEWHAWQRDCFLRERIQPFKQVFRELYVLTAAEAEDGTRSRRYAGHQVNPRQAMALLQARGWVNQPEEGPRRTFHDQGLTASVGVLGGWSTPAEVEGLTLETLEFTRRGEWTALPLSEVPPRIFSEVMRDLDLVVSVAHQGGVDPEASTSTVEIRAALLRETCALLKLENVRLRGNHALVDGTLGEYSVHLGSAVVHRQPGGSLCIVPVHGQHRGRLFLPFADDDPKTAEVVSKVLLLARDDQIRDPTILEQLLVAP